MFQSTPIFKHPNSGTLSLFAMKAIVTALLLNPFLVQAEQDLTIMNIQAAAESNALELGRVVADDHWTRIEFSKVYVDPVVVVEPVTDNAKQAYVVGIRNVDAMGFEINLKSCNHFSEAPIQESINFSVVDNSQLPATEPANTGIRQRFAWGECVSISS